MGDLVYLSNRGPGAKSVSIQTPTWAPTAAVSEQICCISVHHFFSSTTFSSTTSFISCVLPALVHFFQSDAELG